MCGDFVLRNASSGEQGAETLVFEDDGPGGPLHLQGGLYTSALVFLEPPLEVLDKLLAAGPREPLVVAVSDRGCGGLGLETSCWLGIDLGRRGEGTRERKGNV